MSELFPHESKLLKLNDPCLLDGCSKVGDSIIIETKINTVEGILSYIDTKGQIKVKYNAIDAGYTLGYQLDNCEIESIRCFVCCDDRYFALESCELTTESLNALFGEDKPEGEIFAYSGDANEPDCLWKYKGTGDFLDPDNWIDEYGRIPAQLESMPEDQIAQFVNWLSLIFEGNGISFNANSEDGKITVTVLGDGYVGATSFVVSYEDGYIHFNPGDGSGVKTAMLVEHGDGPPSEPYNWFTYINDLTNSVYLNNNGVAMLLGTLEDSNLDTCTGIINCINFNLNNPPEKDKYALPELDDAPWIVKQVVYGDPSQIADFTDCDGTDLDDLVIALNSCPNNPTGWIWINNGGVLTVCVPPGTGILTISYGTPTAVVNFAGIPTEAGDDYPDLCQELANCIVDRNLVPQLKASSESTEEDIEDEFSSFDIVTVRWTDSSGRARISYKDPINGWYHQNGGAGTIFLDTPVILKELLVNTTFNGNENVAGVGGISANARSVYCAALCYASTGSSLIRIHNDYFLVADPTKLPYECQGGNPSEIRHFNVKLKSDGSLDLVMSVPNAASSYARVLIIGYSE